MARGITLSTKQILFRVQNAEHNYVIYTNGEIEGFGQGALVFNYFPAILKEAVAHQPHQPANQLPMQMDSDTGPHR